MEYINPYSSSTRWLRGNIHMHQFCSGHLDLGASGHIYKLLHYDFVAITDHNQTHGRNAIAQWERQAGLIIVPGEENGKTDHMLEIGVHEVTPTPSDDYLERAKALRAAGGFVMGCHPQIYANGEDNVRRAADELHAVEIFNALKEGRGSDEERNIAFWDELLTEGKRIWGVASDDFHASIVGPGQGWVGVQVPEDAHVTWPLIVEQLKRGAFYASTYPGFTSFDLTHEVLRVVATRKPCGLRVIGPGGTVLKEYNGSELEWPVQAGLDYFRVEVVNGRKCAWSQPFFRA